ncbi:hypothetical protein [Tsuneonella sp. HG222]
MNPKMLAATRLVLRVATAVTFFIIKHSAKIVTVATWLHAASLRASVALADKKVAKAYDNYQTANLMIAQARSVATRQYADFSALADARDIHEEAAFHELNLIGAK